MKATRKVGDTSNILLVFIQDTTSTTGGGLTGLAFGTSGLACYYKRDVGTASVSVSLATITTLGTFAGGTGSTESAGFKEIDSVNMPGWYEFHPPDHAFISGAKSVGFSLRGAANMAPLTIEIQLSGVAIDVDQSVTLDAGGAQTLTQILSAAWAQGYGKWVIAGTTLTLYGPDGSTAIRTFTLNSATAPTSRTP